ncbi:alanine racemase [Thermaurantiacus tibetensis]|uniref:alanine racemase n=1 Tax=Thermaurantiacus tibetensis TaxID=2759035 RepID=UPI002E294EAA|nr:alanine racemase [Thermaurantiacus tibetensis]
MEQLTALLARIPPPRTPALVVRRAALEANLAAMQAACDAAGVRLRAHGKMHKASAIGRMQVARGAVGLCCQTVGEAEAFAAAGIADLLVTAPVPPWGAAPLAALAAAGYRVAAVADSPAQVARLADAATALGTTLGLLVDVDLGQRRSGVPPAEAPALARLAAAAPGLRFEGLQCYLGHLQHHAQRAAAHAAAVAELARLVEALRAAGLAPATVTGGGTGTAPLDLASGVFTELQAGSYAFMDVQYAEAGAEFAPALFLATAVVSATHRTHVTVDAGLKALAADGPPPRVVAGAPEGSRFRFQGDEHGAIVHPAALPHLATAADTLALAGAVARLDCDSGFRPDPPLPPEGALVWLQPGHVDPTVNLHAALFLADEDGALARVAVDARRAA